MYGADSKLKAFLCKEKDCEVRHYESEFRVVSLATFIQSLTLPQAVSFSSFKNRNLCIRILSFGTFSVDISECILVERSDTHNHDSLRFEPKHRAIIA